MGRDLEPRLTVGRGSVGVQPKPYPLSENPSRRSADKFTQRDLPPVHESPKTALVVTNASDKAPDLSPRGPKPGRARGPITAKRAGSRLLNEHNASPGIAAPPSDPLGHLRSSDAPQRHRANRCGGHPKRPLRSLYDLSPAGHAPTRVRPNLRGDKPKFDKQRPPKVTAPPPSRTRPERTPMKATGAPHRKTKKSAGEARRFFEQAQGPKASWEKKDKPAGDRAAWRQHKTVAGRQAVQGACEG